jgi:hypothetical protein
MDTHKLIRLQALEDVKHMLSTCEGDIDFALFKLDDMIKAAKE